MKRQYSFILLFTLFFAMLFSCKKVVHIDLNSASPRLVIEANISNLTGPYFVKISKTINFDQSNNFPPVTGAIVVINDDAGFTETLTESGNGIYKTQNLVSKPGRKYTITITTGGQTYESTSYMPPPIEIDKLSVDIAFDRDKRISVSYQDPPNILNYYRCIEIVNGNELADISVEDDKFKDGAVIVQTIFNEVSKYKLKSGDHVTVILQTIDKGTFDYFRTLDNILRQDGGGGPPPTAPTNPLSSFSNNALGYFNTYSQTQKSIIVP